MKAQKHISSIPESGVLVVIEGLLTRLFFDFTPVVPPNEEEPAPEDLYECESIDVEGREYGEIISAIVKSRYNFDSNEALNANYNLAKDESSSLTPEKRAEYLAEYEAYQSWRVHAKEVAKVAESIIKG